MISSSTWSLLFIESVHVEIPGSKKNSMLEKNSMGEFFGRIFGVKNRQKNSSVEFFFEHGIFFRAWNFDMNAPNIYYRHAFFRHSHRRYGGAAIFPEIFSQLRDVLR